MYRLMISIYILIFINAAVWQMQPLQLAPTNTPGENPNTTPGITIPQTTLTPQATGTLPISIHNPLPGQAIQGKIFITGISAMTSFQSAEITFGYANDPTETWFFIASSSEPVKDGTLAEWDTTTLSDGEYDLRLMVNLVDGSQLFVIVPGLRIRNYTPIETVTPTQVTPTPAKEEVEVATQTPTSTPVLPTPTAFPENPLQISSRDLATSLGKGALFTLGLFALAGLYSAVRKILSNR